MQPPGFADIGLLTPLQRLSDFCASDQRLAFTFVRIAVTRNLLAFGRFTELPHSVIVAP
jgi:hypothetical protein